MTKQEMFDKAVGGILAQGGPALHENGTMCMYRAPNGNKCAAGHLIPDERYNRDMEGFGSYNDLVLDGLGITKEDTEIVEFIGQLQSAHDSASMRKEQFMLNFRLNAQRIADEHNLNTDVLN